MSIFLTTQDLPVDIIFILFAVLHSLAFCSQLQLKHAIRREIPPFPVHFPTNNLLHDLSIIEYVMRVNFCAFFILSLSYFMNSFILFTSNTAWYVTFSTTATSATSLPLIEYHLAFPFIQPQGIFSTYQAASYLCGWKEI